MFKRIINWLFGKTSLGKFIDGKKTEIGFFVWCISWFIVLVAEAAKVFPQVSAFPEIVMQLTQLQEFVQQYLANAGFAVMTVGVGHKAIKESEEKKRASEEDAQFI